MGLEGGLAVDVQLICGLDEVPERARALTAAGADGLFTFEGPHDVFFPLVIAAGAVETDLMTNVAIAFPRSPVHLAHAAYDLHLLSRGRFRLGLGSQIRPHIERRYGATWSRPVARMRETVEATRAVLRRWQGLGPLDFRGEFTTHTLMTPNFDPGPHPYGVPPIHVGALGPRMTEMAAEVADGLLVMPFNSRAHLVERTLPAVERGLAAAGRDRADLEVVCEVIVAVGDTPAEIEAATTGVRRLLAFYGSTPSYRPVLEVEGRADLQPRLNALSKQGGWAAMSDLVDDELFDLVAVRGTPAECAEAIIRRFGDVADRVCLYFPGYPITDDCLGRLVTAVQGLRSRRG